MDRRTFLCASATLAGTTVLDGSAQISETPHHVHAASVMTECANRFMAALDRNQRGKALIPFDSEERKHWQYVPDNSRKGLALIDMSAHQKHLAGALLAAGLSQRGYIKARTIMSLEEALRVIEKDSGERRNPEKYYFSIFGTPGDSGPWGYRVEGHHLSQNYTVVNGYVVDVPSFFGANPAEMNGMRTLAGEDDLGIELMHALDEQQRKVAIVNAVAYPEILTAASRQAALKGQPSGLVAANMKPRQFDALRALIEEYARNMPDDMAAARMAEVDRAGRNIYFAWAGGIGRGEKRYYRVQTASFLIEFDDTQDNANHIHTVWRDLRNDFGEDLLHRHYQTSHDKH